MLNLKVKNKLTNVFDKAIKGLSKVGNFLSNESKDTIDKEVDNPLIKTILQKALKVADNIHDKTINKILDSKVKIIDKIMEKGSILQKKIKNELDKKIDLLFGKKPEIANPLKDIVQFSDDLHDLFFNNTKNENKEVKIIGTEQNLTNEVL